MLKQTYIVVAEYTPCFTRVNVDYGDSAQGTTILKKRGPTGLYREDHPDAPPLLAAHGNVSWQFIICPAPLQAELASPQTPSGTR